MGVQKALNRRWGGSDMALLIPSVPPRSPAVITRILPTRAQSRARVTAPPRTPGPPPRASVSPLGAPPTLSTQPLAAPGAPRSPTRVRDRSVQGGAVPGGGPGGCKGWLLAAVPSPPGYFWSPSPLPHHVMGTVFKEPAALGGSCGRGGADGAGARARDTGTRGHARPRHGGGFRGHLEAGGHGQFR